MRFDVNINGIDVNAVYSEESIRRVFLPLLHRMDSLQKEKGRRVLVMLAAPPAAGKSTLCLFLQKLAEAEPSVQPITVIGMDGFHRRQEYLLRHTLFRDGQEIPMVEVKGCPDTFDLPLLREAVGRVAAGEECGWPEYDRMNHNPREDAIRVTGKIVLLEGNYLLLDQDGWRELRQYADLTLRILADPGDLRERLLERKMASGASPGRAAAFVEKSDLYNARLVLDHFLPADITLVMERDGEYRLQA